MRTGHKHIIYESVMIDRLVVSTSSALDHTGIALTEEDMIVYAR